jgi:hypothetical protein
MMEQIAENRHHALTCRYSSIPINHQKMENVLYKIYQNLTDSTSDKWFCDLAFKGQMLFTCNGKGCAYPFPSNTELEDTAVVDNY